MSDVKGEKTLGEVMHQPSPQSNSDSNWKIFKIGCSILLSFFVLSILGFYWLCNTLMEKSEAYENTLTELTGVFQSDHMVVAPLSGDSAVAVHLEIDITNSTGSSKSPFSSDDYDILLFDRNARFISGGRSYVMIGVRPFRTFWKVKPVSEIEFECTGRGDEPPQIPQSLFGLDVKLDKKLNEYRNRDCGFGVDRSWADIKEYLHNTSDSITIKALVRNDTIYLY